MLPAVLICLGLALPMQESPGQGPATGTWHARLQSPGGPLPFALELAHHDGRWSAVIRNASERIALPDVTVHDSTIEIAIPHFAATITAHIADAGRRLDGAWRKRVLGGGDAELPFHATAGARDRFPLSTSHKADLTGRWRVDFEHGDDAVATFTQNDAGLVTGTFETPTGDYRWLEGTLIGNRLRLSCFDGAHAFLFDAELADTGVLAGHFWSRDSWHEEWLAARDPEAALPDPFAVARWEPRLSVSDIVLPQIDPDADPASDEPLVARSLSDPALLGTVRLLVLFGSWCPNCHDEAAALVDLHARYAERGLSIIGLAFELTGEFATDAEQVRRFARRHGTSWPMLLAGRADKVEATAAVPLLDSVRAFPTTILLGKDGEPRFVHSGWSGPATGPAHDRLTVELVARIERALDEPAPDARAIYDSLEQMATRWYDLSAFAGGDLSFDFERLSAPAARVRIFGSGRPVISDRSFPVRVVGDALALGDKVLVIDRAAGVLRNPRSWGGRYLPWDGAEHPNHARRLGDEPEAWRALVHQPDPAGRAEAITALAALATRQPGPLTGLAAARELLRDPDPLVRRASIWAVGQTHDREALPALTELAHHPDAGQRREVARALLRMSSTSETARTILLSMAQDSDPDVRAAVHTMQAKRR